MLEALYSAFYTIMIVVGITAVGAGIYVTYEQWRWRQYANATGRQSWLLDTMLASGIIDDIAGIYLAFLAIRRLLGFEPIEWTPVITLLAITVLVVKKTWKYRRILSYADRQARLPPHRGQVIE